MDSIQLRIRIDGAIAQKALEMAQARGMDLPDVVRMMLTKAVQIGDFSIEKELAQHQQLEERSRQRPYFDYDESQWNSMKTVLEAELALALVNQFIAFHTLEIEALTNQEPPDAERIGHLSQQRDRARRILATLDPADTKSVQAILEEFGPPAESSGPAVPGEASEGGQP